MNLKIEQVDSKKEEEVEIGFEIEKRVVVVEPVVELEPKLVEQLVVGSRLVVVVVGKRRLLHSQLHFVVSIIL